MVYNSSISLNQDKKRHTPNKSSLDSPPIISPILISKAAAIGRRRLRHQSRLECFALVCLISFARQSKQALADLEKKPLVYGFNTITEGVQTVVFDKEGTRTTAYLPANFYYTKCFNAAIKPQLLLDYHSSLSEQTTIVLKQALDWHLNKCRELWAQYGSLPPLEAN
jgi:hypothetical protein